jgi:hypothetical protein
MNNVPSSRGRWIFVIGAIFVVGSCFLQWWEIGGGKYDLPRVAGSGFSPETGPVFPMFVAGIAALFLATLPFASETSIGIDHPVAYLSLWATMLLFFIWTATRLAQQSMLPFPPQLGVGLWVAMAGLAIQVRGVFELFEERRRRLY